MLLLSSEALRNVTQNRSIAMANGLKPEWENARALKQLTDT